MATQHKSQNIISFFRLILSTKTPKNELHSTAGSEVHIKKNPANAKLCVLSRIYSGKTVKYAILPNLEVALPSIKKIIFFIEPVTLSPKIISHFTQTRGNHTNFTGIDKNYYSNIITNIILFFFKI